MSNRELILDGTKIAWHLEKVQQWERGERFAPITIDMALTRACNYACSFCYAQMQENNRSIITKKVMDDFLDEEKRYSWNILEPCADVKIEDDRLKVHKGFLENFVLLT